MEKMHSMVDQVDACVARICGLGCANAYRSIARLEAGQMIPEMAAADAGLRRAVLMELKQIMSVYDAREGGPACGLD